MGKATQHLLLQPEDRMTMASMSQQGVGGQAMVWPWSGHGAQLFDHHA